MVSGLISANRLLEAMEPIHEHAPLQTIVDAETSPFSESSPDRGMIKMMTRRVSEYFSLIHRFHPRSSQVGPVDR